MSKDLLTDDKVEQYNKVRVEMTQKIDLLLQHGWSFNAQGMLEAPEKHYQKQWCAHWYDFPYKSRVVSIPHWLGRADTAFSEPPPDDSDFGKTLPFTSSTTK